VLGFFRFVNHQTKVVARIAAGSAFLITGDAITLPNFIQFRLKFREQKHPLEPEAQQLQFESS